MKRSVYSETGIIKVGNFVTRDVAYLTVDKDGNLIMHPIIYMKNFEILWHVRQSPTVPHDRNFYFVSCKILSKLFLFSEEVRFFFNGDYFFTNFTIRCCSLKMNIPDTDGIF